MSTQRIVYPLVGRKRKTALLLDYGDRVEVCYRRKVLFSVEAPERPRHNGYLRLMANEWICRNGFTHVTVCNAEERQVRV